VDDDADSVDVTADELGRERGRAVAECRARRADEDNSRERSDEDADAPRDGAATTDIVCVSKCSAGARRGATKVSGT